MPKSSAEYSRVYRERHPDRVAAAQKRWRSKNRARVRELQDRWTSKNPDRVKEYQRKADKKRHAENPEKHRARSLVAYHVGRGNLKREPCEVCGAEKVEAHHDDYSKPLDVRWLCHTHHRETHVT